jgi:hypothetical protein
MRSENINELMNIDELMNFDDNQFMSMDFNYTNTQQYILRSQSPISVANVKQFEIPTRPKLRRQYAVIISR